MFERGTKLKSTITTMKVIVLDRYSDGLDEFYFVKMDTNEKHHPFVIRIGAGIWSEYKEPRTYEKWLVMYEGNDGIVYCSRYETEAAARGYKPWGTVLEILKFNWTEKV